MEDKREGTAAAGGLSKEEMARRIAGNIGKNASVDYDVQYREDLRRRGEIHSEFAAKAMQPQRRQAGYSQGAAGSRKKSGRKKSAAEKKRLKKKKRQKRILICVVSLTLLLAAAAAGGGIWYSTQRAKYDGVFLDNTYINGADVSGMTPKQAAEVVTQDSDMPDVITLTTPDGGSVTIDLEQLDAKNNIAETVEGYYSSQDHNRWLSARRSKTEFNFKVHFEFDRELLHKEVNRRIVEGQKATEPENAYIERTDDGFEIVPEVLGTSIAEDKVESLYEYIDGFIDRSVYAIDLSDCGCYEMPEITSLDLRDQLDQLNSLYDVEFTFEFGYASETLKGSETIDWITFDNDDPRDGYTVDEDKAMEYVEKLAEKYDTYGTERKFVSTTRGEMTLEQGEGDYGWWIDQAKTCALIVDLVEEGVSADVEPYYYVNPDSQYTYTCNPEVRTAEDDIGDTYIEIDLKEQHFWYYEKGELEYECDIVSGKPTAARNTPGGIYKLWYKERNKTLTGSNSAGESWSTPVTFWNNVSTFGVGLHDATWHSYFGGERYINYGSHGCINMPYAAAEYVFENIELDTPVIMYW